jgi:hypothetical protein
VTLCVLWPCRVYVKNRYWPLGKSGRGEGSSSIGAIPQYDLGLGSPIAAVGVPDSLTIGRREESGIGVQFDSKSRPVKPSTIGVQLQP